ncbi:glutathione S-transferase family protein [Pusillimonas sp. ANT_WB101]|nr:glutathione S-transferase family protein [Pusillimonas sp. ANT_WB101]
MNKSYVGQPFILYHGWRSSASRRVRLCLAEKGLSYESRLVNMLKGEQHSPEYLSINPNGVVPALLHGDRVLYESSAIAEYLDELFPEPSIRPRDAYDRLVMRNFVRWVDDYCLPRLIVFNWSQAMQAAATQWSDRELAERIARVPSASRKEAWTRVARKPYSDEEKADAMTGLLKLLEKMQAMLANDHSWIVGERLSIADLAAIPFVMRINELNPSAIANFPFVESWWNRVRQRPSFSEARICAFTATDAEVEAL